MTDAERHTLIVDLIDNHTLKVTASQDAARSWLIQIGVYAPEGHLTPEYGGKTPATR